MKKITISVERVISDEFKAFRWFASFRRFYMRFHHITFIGQACGLKENKGMVQALQKG